MFLTNRRDLTHSILSLGSGDGYLTKELTMRQGESESTPAYRDQCIMFFFEYSLRNGRTHETIPGIFGPWISLYM